MAKKMTEAERLAERKRVDDYMAAAKRRAAQQRAATKKKPAPKKVYPGGVSLLGQGFRNLYDVLSGRPMTPKKKK